MDNFFDSYEEGSVNDFWEDVVYTDSNSNEEWWFDFWYRKAYC